MKPVIYLRLYVVSRELITAELGRPSEMCATFSCEAIALERSTTVPMFSVTVV